MHLTLCAVALIAVLGEPAAAQQVTELAAGAWASTRGSSSEVAPGAGVVAGVGRDRVLVIAEVSGTRRSGHNDWRTLGGVRLWLADHPSAGAYVLGMAGAKIRSGDASRALLAGVGLEFRRPGRLLGVRLQLDVTRDRFIADDVTGVRLSLWLARR